MTRKTPEEKNIYSEKQKTVARELRIDLEKFGDDLFGTEPPSRNDAVLYAASYINNTGAVAVNFIGGDAVWEKKATTLYAHLVGYEDKDGAVEGILATAFRAKFPGDNAELFINDESGGVIALARKLRNVELNAWGEVAKDKKVRNLGISTEKKKREMVEVNSFLSVPKWLAGRMRMVEGLYFGGKQVEIMELVGQEYIIVTALDKARDGFWKGEKTERMPEVLAIEDAKRYCFEVVGIDIENQAVGRDRKVAGQESSQGWGAMVEKACGKETFVDMPRCTGNIVYWLGKGLGRGVGGDELGTTMRVAGKIIALFESGVFDKYCEGNEELKRKFETLKTMVEAKKPVISCAQAARRVDVSRL